MNERDRNVDQQPDDPAAQQSAGQSAGQPAGRSGGRPDEVTPPRRRRRWPWILGVGVVALLLVVLVLIAIAPAIWSDQIRHYATGQINQSIQGRVEIDGWSLGWFGPQQIDRLRILDPSGNVIAVAENVLIPVRLTTLLAGGRDLGHVKVGSLHLDLRIGPSGETNIATAFYSRAPSDKPVETPPWKFAVDVQRFYGSVAGGAAASQPAEFDGTLSAAASHGLDQPLSHKLNVSVSSPSHSGRLTSSGEVTLFNDNRFDPRLSQLHANTNLEQVPAEMLNLIPMGGEVVWRSGHLTGLVQVAPSGDHAGLDAMLDWQAMADLPVTGESVTVRSGHTKVNGVLQPGLLQLNDIRQTLTVAATQPAEQVVDVTGQFQVSWGEQDSAAEDAVQLTGWVDLAGLANSLPGLARRIGLRENLTLNSGRVTFDEFRLAGFGDTQSLSGGMSLSEVNGVRVGQRVTFSPVTIRGKAVISPDSFAFPGGLMFRARWAEIHAAGELRDFELKTVRQIDLGGLYNELGQFFDMGGWRFAGTATVNATSKSAGPGEPVELAGQFSLLDLKIWRDNEGIIHDRNIVVALDVQGRPGEPWHIRKLDIDAQQSRLIVLHSSGQYVPSGQQAGLSLAGDYRVNFGVVQALAGSRWPSGVTLQSADGQIPFSMYWPMGRGTGDKLSAIDRLIGHGRVDTGLMWTRASVRGLDIGQPAGAVPVRLADSQINIGPQQAPANGGMVTISGLIDLRRDVPWLTIGTGQPVQVMRSVQINDQIAQGLMPLLNPMLADAKTVSGQIQLSISELNIPLDGQAIERQGRARGRLRIDNFQATGGLLADLSGMLGVVLTGKRGLIDQPIDFRDGRLYFRESVVRVGASEFFLNGWIWVLSEAEARRVGEETMKLTITIKLTPQLLRQTLGKFVLDPLGIKPGLAEVPVIIALRGTPYDPKPDVQAFTREMLKAAGEPLTTPLKPLKDLFGDEE